MKLPTLVSVLGAAVLAQLPTTASAAIDLSFGLYTSNKPTAMVRQFRPVLDAVEKRLEHGLQEPVTIRIQVAKTYAQGIEHLASGKVDFSRFGPASYIEAKRANAGVQILAMERQDGDKVFYGVIVVKQDSDILGVEQLRGRSFAFGSDQSTIGRYLSQLYLRDHGVFAVDLSRFDYLDRHDKVGTAVGAGHFDAGALNETTFNKLVKKGVAIREIARFPNVTKPWIARSGLPPRVFAALQQALLELDDPAALKRLKKDGFMLGDDGDYVAIRTAIENNGIFFEPRTTVAEHPELDSTGGVASLDGGSERPAIEDNDGSGPRMPVTDGPGLDSPDRVASVDEGSARAEIEDSDNAGPRTPVTDGPGFDSPDGAASLDEGSARAAIEDKGNSGPRAPEADGPKLGRDDASEQTTFAGQANAATAGGDVTPALRANPVPTPPRLSLEPVVERERPAPGLDPDSLDDLDDVEAFDEWSGGVPPSPSS